MEFIRTRFLPFLMILFFVFILFFIYMLHMKVDWRLKNYEIHGLDISHYQKDIDFKKLKKSKYVDFVFVKAIEGFSVKDKKFHQNWAGLKANNITRGAYHFYRPSAKAKTQALAFIRRVKLSKGDLPPVLDLEETDNRSKDIILKGVKIWLETVERHYGVKPIIYVNQDFYYNYIEGNLEEYPIWIAAYRWSKPDVREGDWQFWQYTDKGKIKGISGYVDRNVFVGNLADFKVLQL